MSEYIKEIKEVIDVKEEGYDIVTSKQVIKMRIDSKIICCENSGYIASEDSFKEFIGSELFDVKVTNDSLQTKTLLRKEKEYIDGKFEDCALFITLETSKGSLQFVMYNEHNGYYAHYIYIESEQVSEDCYI